MKNYNHNKNTVIHNIEKILQVPNFILYNFFLYDTLTLLPIEHFSPQNGVLNAFMMVCIWRGDLVRGQLCSGDFVVGDFALG